MERHNAQASDTFASQHNSVKFRPLGARALVAREKKKAQTSSGLFLPTDESSNKNNFGTVVAVGLGRLDKEGKRVPLEVSVGQRILFSQYGGTDVKSEGENSGESYVLVNEDDILAIVE